MKLTDLLLESAKDDAALDYLAQLVQKGPFKNRVFLAGGSPRDMQLGLSPKDLDVVVKGGISAGIDFATWATKEIGNFKDGSNPVIFPTYGTAKFTLQGVEHKGHDLSDVDVEAVAPRKEKYTPGSRKPEVSGGELEDDVQRRDFTVNSLLHDLTTGETLDLTGMGKADIKAGIVRTPLDPDVIFSDDPLRILRAVRFATKYDWKLPMFMIRSIRKNAATLSTISRERIHDEVNKMLLLPTRATKALRLLKMLRLMPYVFPSLDKVTDEQLRASAIDSRPIDLALRLAAAFYSLPRAGDVAEKELRSTKYDTATIQMVKTILDNYRGVSDGNNDPMQFRTLVSSIGENKATQVVRFLAGDAKNEASAMLQQQIQLMRANPLPVTGQDLISLGMKSGPALGAALKAIKGEYIKDPKTPTERYLSIAKQFI